MKKFLVSIAIAGLTIFCASAYNGQQVEMNTVQTEMSISQNNDSYKPIKLEELNAKVQEAIKGFESKYAVKSLAFDAGKKLTKVTLISKADSSAKIVVLNEEGKEMPTTTAPAQQ